MEKNYNTDDTFLGRWISGELSDEELANFKKTDAYKEFQRINSESKLLDGPEIDIESALKKVNDKIAQSDSKPISSTKSLWIRVGIAAALIISLGFYLNSSKTIENAIGKTQTITLSDGSEINLNSNSSISYKRFFWETNKKVSLKGEAFFTVVKGDGFEVHTSRGTISVLGTKFNIRNRTAFDLKCYEGKVEFSNVDTKISPEILTKGMHLKITKDFAETYTFEEDEPSWKKGFSKFDKQPLHLVLEEITQYYEITFEVNSVDTSRLFSGSFQHNDLELALKSTLIPMGIKYELFENTIILSE